jgi:hypothetical protein
MTLSLVLPKPKNGQLRFLLCFAKISFEAAPGSIQTKTAAASPFTSSCDSSVMT